MCVWGQCEKGGRFKERIDKDLFQLYHLKDVICKDACKIYGMLHLCIIKSKVHQNDRRLRWLM